MKKMLCLLMALIMCASLFAACGGEKEKESDSDSDSEKNMESNVSDDANTEKDKDPSSLTVKLIEKDGVVYFENTDAVPEIVLTGETDIVVEDAQFYEKLVNAIDGKSIVKDVCNCKAIYIVRMGGYTVELHGHSIALYAGNSTLMPDLIGTIDDCTKEEMNELLAILSALIGEKQT
ncbi:MAG: hypothetical protein E7599_06975 [Ruminococcaceae bacterium]|nr:hypothetical protein [Oscillospiraceae bacterium]